MKKIIFIFIIGFALITLTLDGNSQSKGFSFWSGAPFIDTLDADFTTLILPRLNVSTPDSVKNHYNTFIIMLKDSANLSTIAYGNGLDFFYWFGAWDSTSSKINWCGDTNNMTTFNACTFTQYQGWLTTATAYLNTNFNPLADGISYMQNNASIGLYSRTDNSSAGWDMGCDDIGANGVTIALKWSTTYYAKINCVQQTVGVVANSLGLYAINKYSVNSNDYIKNGISLSTSTSASASLKNLNMYIGGINYNGVFDKWTSRQYLCAYGGKSFTVAEHRGVFNCIEWLADKLGVGVVP